MDDNWLIHLVKFEDKYKDVFVSILNGIPVKTNIDQSSDEESSDYYSDDDNMGMYH